MTALSRIRLWIIGRREFERLLLEMDRAQQRAVAEANALRRAVAS